MRFKTAISAFIAGLLFGLGLIVSEMVNPQRVRGFLDVAGNWDPTLLFVMGGALSASFIGYRLVLSRAKPWFQNEFSLPANKQIDKRLLVGAMLFGCGWGLAGLCPGPALVALSTLNSDILIFVVAMVVGMKLFERVV